MTAKKSEMQQIEDDGVISALTLRIEKEQADLNSMVVTPTVSSARVAEQAEIVQILREEMRVIQALKGA